MIYTFYAINAKCIVQVRFKLWSVLYVLELQVAYTHSTFSVLAYARLFAPVTRALTNLVYSLHDGIAQHEISFKLRHGIRATSPIYPAAAK